MSLNGFLYWLSLILFIHTFFVFFLEFQFMFLFRFWKKCPHFCWKKAHSLSRWLPGFEKTLDRWKTFFRQTSNIPCFGTSIHIMTLDIQSYLQIRRCFCWYVFAGPVNHQPSVSVCGLGCLGVKYLVWCEFMVVNFTHDFLWILFVFTAMRMNGFVSIKFCIWCITVLVD